MENHPELLHISTTTIVIFYHKYDAIKSIVSVPVPPNLDAIDFRDDCQSASRDRIPHTYLRATTCAQNRRRQRRRQHRRSRCRRGLFMIGDGACAHGSMCATVAVIVFLDTLARARTRFFCVCVQLAAGGLQQPRQTRETKTTNNTPDLRVMNESRTPARAAHMSTR